MKNKIFTLPVIAGLGLLLGAIFLLPSPFVKAQNPVDTTFTYQGRLLRSERYLDNVACDFQFDLYAVPDGGVSVASTQMEQDVLLTDGYFTVDLNFGPQFRDEERYLAIKVKCPPETGYTSLAGRVKINPAPQSLYALEAKSLDLNCDDNQVPLWNGGVWTCGAWTTPMKSGSKENVTATQGDNYIFPDDDNFAFTPQSTMTCMVIATASFHSTDGAIEDPNPFLLTAKQTVGSGDSHDGQPPIYFANLDGPADDPPIKGPDGTSAAATHVWQIDAGAGATKFGCYVYISKSNWTDGEKINCRVSYICQGGAD